MTDTGAMHVNRWLSPDPEQEPSHPLSDPPLLVKDGDAAAASGEVEIVPGEAPQWPPAEPEASRGGSAAAEEAAVIFGGGQARQAPPQSSPAPAGHPPNGYPAAGQGYAPVLAPPQSQQGGDPGAAGWGTRGVQAEPESGWQRLAYRLTFKKFNPGENPRDVSERELTRRIQAPVSCRTYAVSALQVKGGCGKTPTILGVGNELALVRSGDVIATDMNPDVGTLSDRAKNRDQRGTVRNFHEFVRDDKVVGRRDVEGKYAIFSEANLPILASSVDPATGDSMRAQDYEVAWDRLKDDYGLVLNDLGTGLTHPSVAPVLVRTRRVLVPIAAREDHAHAAWQTLDWLFNEVARDPQSGEAATDRYGQKIHPFRHLCIRPVVVISHQAPGKPLLSVKTARERFEGRGAIVHEIPFDPHLAEGNAIDPRRLLPPTRRAYRELAAMIADDFAQAAANDNISTVSTVR